MMRWLVVFVAVLVGGTAWVWWSQVPADAQVQNLTPEPALGRPAPDFELVALDGSTFALSEVRGMPVVLNFWATWCGPCQRELPALDAAAERYDGAVLVAAVDQGESADVVQSYVDELGLSFVIPMDEELDVSGRYRVRGLPTTFFIDEDGVIRHIWTGEMNSITLAEGIAKIWP